jgi:nucleoside-diphosphate-sugar epimerase
MRIFVTGATGVIGRRVVSVLLRNGHQATAAARSLSRLQTLERIGAAVVALDLFDSSSVRASIAGHDVAINLATHVPTGVKTFLPGAWKQNDRIRREASALLVDEAIRAGAQVYLQESFVTYPDSGDRWVTEEVSPEPPSYNRTVLDAEASALRFAWQGGRGVVLRFAYFYGPNDDFTATLAASVRRGWLPIPGQPQGYFSMVMHDDAAAAVVAALEAPSGIYNVVEDEPLTRRLIGDVLAGHLGVSPPKLLPPWVAHLAGSVGEMLSRSIRMSNAKLKHAVGWAPKYPSLKEGLLAARGN